MTFARREKRALKVPAEIIQMAERVEARQQPRILPFAYRPVHGCDSTRKSYLAAYRRSLRRAVRIKRGVRIGKMPHFRAQFFF